MKINHNKTKWAKIGDISKTFIMGKDVLMFGSGCHLIFVNLTTGEEHLYTANNPEAGDGVDCFCTNRLQNVFAFSEKCNNPRVFIKNYPDFDHIFTITDDPRGYINILFSDTSVFLTLGDLPTFTLTAWNWRKGEKLASKDSNVLYQNQFLRCNMSSLVRMGQLAVNTNLVHIWDVFLCGRKCVLNQHLVKTPQKCNPFTSFLWTTEGGALVLDSAGCVYTVLPNYSTEQVISSTDSGTLNTSFASFKGGIVICGPSDKIRHFKKTDDIWVINWEIIPPVQITKIASRLELLIGISWKSNILQLSQNADDCKFLRKNQSAFTDVCIINPLGEYLVTLQSCLVLNGIEIATGELVSTFELESRALVIAENPKFPYVALGYENGHLALISYYKVDVPEQLTDMFLCKNEIDHVYFNECGTIFVAANFKIGLFFIIEGLPGAQIEVIATVEANQQIAHSMMVMSYECYRIFAIPVTSPVHVAGNKIVRYCVVKEKGIDVKEYTFRDKNALYAYLVPTIGLNRDRNFYAIPYFGKCIEEIEIRRGDLTARVLKKTVTGHQMRNIRFKWDRTHALTWAYDGLIIARKSNFIDQVGIAQPHHRADGGVLKAIIDPYGKYIVSLGQDNVLACTDLLRNSIDQDLYDQLEDTLTSYTYSILFTQTTIGFNPKGTMKGKCYLEYKELKQFEKERKLSEKDRAIIMKEFKLIKESLQELLTTNLEGPENELLDMLEFNLDKQMYTSRSYKHEIYCKAIEVYLKDLIIAQNNVADLMIKQFWETTETPLTSIQSFFANFDVANYALFPPNLNQEALLNAILHQRKVENFLNNNKMFDPWIPRKKEDLLKELDEKPKVVSGEHLKILQMNEDDEEGVFEKVEDEHVFKETKIAMFGSDLQKYITPETTHYLQYELDTYFQSQLQWIMTKSDSYKLKKVFNKEFDSIMMSKQKEMSSIKERNSRLHTIVSEINYFSTDKIETTIVNPEWEQTENPELIIQVKDNEVPITPYISKSEQSLINARLAEAERLRLLLLADDFKERALMAMMNGVLEVRWEDELKKDVPIPKCMIEKEPEHFNEEDLRNVRDYEEKVKFLISERERYKNMLQVEYKKVANSVRESIRKFNGKLSDLIVLKLDIDSTVSQEALKLNRLKFNHLKLKLLHQRQQKILYEIDENTKSLDSLTKLMNVLHQRYSELKAVLETVQGKDKIFEKQFRKDFQDSSLVIQEQASKMYKKRPKMNFRAINSGTLLNELARCIATDYKSLVLNQECVDYLKSLEMLDMYVGIPPAVDEITYALICKHRRTRIEYEIRVKAVTTDLNTAETTIADFHKQIEDKREMHLKLNEDLETVRSNILELKQNKDIQIILPRGLVEINLTGSFDDFKDAVLICRKDIEDINNVILDSGAKKLKALEKAMGFKRKILALEWEHKKKMMQIQDLQEKLIDVSGARMTRDIQIHFKNKNRDHQKSPYESEIDWLRASYENSLEDRREQIRKIKHQIKIKNSQNMVINKQITDTNVDICEFNLIKDHNLSNRTKAVIDNRMQVMLERNRMVQEIEETHHELLVLQTELELLRLRTYPTLKYKIINE